MIYFHARIHRFLNDRGQLGVIKIQIMRRYGKSGNKRAGTAPLVGGLAESGRIRKASATAVTMGLTRLLGFTHLGDVPVPDIRSLLVLAVLAAVHFLWKKLRGKVPSPIAMIGLSAVLGILLWSI